MYYSEKEPTIYDSDKKPSHLAKTILSYKNYRWLYEREWRMFGPLGKAYYRRAECVTSVYLGSRIGDRNRERVRKVLEKLGIKCREMKIDKYSISFEPSSEI
jgi:hypothetical protein